MYTQCLSPYVYAVLCLVPQSCPTLCDPVECSPPGPSVCEDSPGKTAGGSCYALLQGIFPTQGSNPGLLNCRGILYHLSHQGSLRILECVAHPFLRGSFWPRNQTEVSWTAGGFFSRWATKESPICIYKKTISVQGRDHWLCWVVNYVI